MYSLFRFSCLCLRSRLPCTVPKSGLRPEKKKWQKKWMLAPPGKKGEKWPKNGKIGPKMGQKWQFSNFSAIFSLFFPVGPKTIFLPIFSRFGPEARFGTCAGQSGFSCLYALFLHTPAIHSHISHFRRATQAETTSSQQRLDIESINRNGGATVLRGVSQALHAISERSPRGSRLSFPATEPPDPEGFQKGSLKGFRRGQPRTLLKTF